MNDFLPSPALLAQIKSFEGFRPNVYQDAAGFATIGYGHRVFSGEQFPDGITEDQASVILARDALMAGENVRRLVTVDLTQAQYDALTDFVFNLGEAALASSTMLRRINAQAWQDAADQCLLWDHAHVDGKLVVLAGLQKRRMWEASQLVPTSPQIEASTGDGNESIVV